MSTLKRTLRYILYTDQTYFHRTLNLKEWKHRSFYANIEYIFVCVCDGTLRWIIKPGETRNYYVWRQKNIMLKYFPTVNKLYHSLFFCFRNIIILRTCWSNFDSNECWIRMKITRNPLLLWFPESGRYVLSAKTFDKIYFIHSKSKTTFTICRDSFVLSNFPIQLHSTKSPSFTYSFTLWA